MLQLKSMLKKYELEAHKKQIIHLMCDRNTVNAADIQTSSGAAIQF